MRNVKIVYKDSIGNHDKVWECGPYLADKAERIMSNLSLLGCTDIKLEPA